MVIHLRLRRFLPYNPPVLRRSLPLAEPPVQATFAAYQDSPFAGVMRALDGPPPTGAAPGSPLPYGQAMPAWLHPRAGTVLPMSV